MSSPASLRSWLNLVVPGDVPDLREEDRRERGADPREGFEQAVGRQRLGHAHQLRLDGGDAGLDSREARDEIRALAGEPRRERGGRGAFLPAGGRGLRAAPAPGRRGRDRAESLLTASAEANVGPDVARTHLQRVLDELPNLAEHFAEVARTRADALLEAHRRARKATRASGVTHRIEPKLPVDILGVYVYLPAE